MEEEMKSLLCLRVFVVTLILIALTNAEETRPALVYKSKRDIKTGIPKGGLYGSSNRLSKLCSPPTSIKNGTIRCTSSAARMSCTATCNKGYLFNDGTDIKKHMCTNYDGTWTPVYGFPDCEPVCDPKCQNEGKCYGNNKCICTPEFRGDTCDYPLSNCDGAKLHPNGNWACNHTNQQTECTISCPPGMTFAFPPPDTYVCDLQGNWSPEYVPNCIMCKIANW